MTYEIICVGSATMDAYVRTEKEKDIISQKKEFIAYPLGAKLLVNDLNFLIGGGGINTSFAIKKLGKKVAYVGAVGKDHMGKQIITDLNKEKIPFIGQITDEKTDFSIVLDSIKRDRTVLNYKNASKHLRFDKIPKSNLKTKWFYFSSLVDESYKCLEDISEYARKNNSKILFNPSYYIAEKGEKYLAKLLANTNILICNLEEARLVLDAKHAPIKILLKRLMFRGPQIVVITDGPNGAYAMRCNKYYYIHGRDVKVIETTGAGDCFASTFLVGIIDKDDMEYALKTAMINAESVISHSGSTERLLTKKEILAKLETEKFQIDIEEI